MQQENIVTGITAFSKGRCKIEIDGRFRFVLYKGELRTYHIKEGERLSDDFLKEILSEVLPKRAKLRSMNLLKGREYTEYQIRDKLKQGLYPEDIVEDALAYVRSFGYLDDLRYAEHFIESRKDQKSKKEIYALLCSKGVPPEQIREAFESCYPEEGEQDAIRRILEKKRVDPEHASGEELRKLCGYLSRKGFRYEEISRALKAFDIPF